MSPSPSRSPVAHLEIRVIASLLVHLAEGRVGVKAVWGNAGPKESSCSPDPSVGLLTQMGLGMLYKGELFLTSRKCSCKLPQPRSFS